MVNIYAELDKLLSSGKKAVLARIIRQVGSAPRAVGTKCLILEDGSVVGTIGGGSLEFQVAGKAQDIFKQEKTSILHFKLTGKEVGQSEMLCGGIVDVFLEPVFPDNEIAKDVFQKANDLIREGKKATLLTLVSEGLAYRVNSRMLIEEDGSTTGGLANMITSDKSNVEKWSQPLKPTLIEPAADGPLVFAEPVEPEAVLYLFGAGHISTFVAPLVKMVGFQVCVIDDRQEFANSARFPNVDEIIVCPFKEAFNRVSINASSYIAIITRGHIHDLAVLRKAAQTNSAYIGMIGSLRKRRMIYESLMEEGISKEKLDRVHSPIGLDIGAETPEEIAVSIVAELIQARLNKPVRKPPVKK
jgi:xanthine dehydrogenase accessory factor